MRENPCYKCNLLEAKNQELLAAWRYRVVGNVHRVPMMFKAKAGSGGFTEYTGLRDHGNRVGKAKRRSGVAKEKALKKLGSAKGQTHMEDYVKG